VNEEWNVDQQWEWGSPEDLSVMSASNKGEEQKEEVEENSTVPLGSDQNSQ
jgi:hypothetical protein